MNREETMRTGTHEIMTLPIKPIIEKELSVAWGNGHAEGVNAGLEAAVRILKRESFVLAMTEKGESDELRD